MRLIDLNNPDLGKPQTIRGVYDRMLISMIDGRNGNAYKNSCLCHSVSIKYVIKKAAPTDKLVIVGAADRITHSFVVDTNGNIVADTNTKLNPEYDGKTYNIKDYNFKVMWVRKVIDIKHDIKKVMDK